MAVEAEEAEAEAEAYCQGLFAHDNRHQVVSPFTNAIIAHG